MLCSYEKLLMCLYKFIGSIIFFVYRVSLELCPFHKMRELTMYFLSFIINEALIIMNFHKTYSTLHDNLVGTHIHLTYEPIQAIFCNY